METVEGIDTKEEGPSRDLEVVTDTIEHADTGLGQTLGGIGHFERAYQTDVKQRVLLESGIHHKVPLSRETEQSRGSGRVGSRNQHDHQQEPTERPARSGTAPFRRFPRTKQTPQSQKMDDTQQDPVGSWP